MEKTMATFEKLKFVAVTKPIHQSAIVQRRNKLIGKIWQQIELVKSQTNGTQLEIKKYKTVKDAAGNSQRIAVNKRIKPWWYQDIEGKLCVSIRYGSKIVELKRGMPSIQVTDFDGLLESLEIIKTEVGNGSFDQEIEQASGALKANFKTK